MRAFEPVKLPPDYGPAPVRVFSLFLHLIACVCVYSVNMVSEKTVQFVRNFSLSSFRIHF